MFIEVFLIDSESSSLWSYILVISSFIGSIFVGLMIAKLRRLGLVVSGAAAGFFFCFLLNYIILWRIDSQPTWVT